MSAFFICGSSGGGKSTFLCNAATQVIQKGFGCAVIDPAGDLIEDIVSRIPENRLGDVVLFDPSEIDCPVGFNPLDANSDAEKFLLSSDLVALFRRFSTSWGSLMEAAVAQAINAFLYNTRAGTLLDLKRFLVERDFRREILRTVTDDGVRYFWEYESAGINSRTLSSVLIRLDGFLRHPLVRNIVCQRSTLNFRLLMEQRKILLVKVSQGLIGQENAALLGSLLVSKIYQIALSRQDTQHDARGRFWLFADEAQNYLAPSLGLILAGTRKYGLGLTLATQSFRYLQNQDPDVAESVLTNCFTRICFRLGDEDAKRFAQGFSFFTPSDLQNLRVGEAIARIERADLDFNLKTPPLVEIPVTEKNARLLLVAAATRNSYSSVPDSAEQIIRPADDSVSPISTPPSVSAAEPVVQNEAERISEPSEATAGPPEIAAADLSTVPERVGSNCEDEGGRYEGRGGAHHQEIQGLVARMAENYGFKAEIEKPVASGRVDVSIENEAVRIACEISVTTTVYEVTNVRKCIAAGYDHIAVVVASKKKIPLIETKIRASVPDHYLSRISVCDVPGFLSFLRSLTGPGKESTKRKSGAGAKRLSFGEACDLLGKSPSTLYRWVREGRIPFFRVGREYKFDRDELLLIGRHDLSGKRKATVKLEPLRIAKNAKKSEKDRDDRYRKLLKLD